MHARPTHPTGIPQQGRHGWSQWHITWSVAIIMGLGLALLSPSTVQARTFQCRAGDVACLIAAIKTANAQPGPQHGIRLAAGVYSLTEPDNSPDPTNPFAQANGLPVVASTLTITRAGPEATVIEGAASSDGPVFRLIENTAGGVLMLKGLTLQGGHILVGEGGSILNRGRLTIDDSVLTGGSVSFGTGGSIFNSGTLTLTHSTLADNYVLRSGGGISNSGTGIITNSTLARNDADFIGGIDNRGILAITNSTIADNFDSYNAGGLGNSGTLTITNSTIAGNRSLGGTGGIANGGTLTITNSTIAENHKIGGLVFPEGSGGLENSGGTVALQNTILARNTVGESGTSDCLGVVTSQGHNLIGDRTGCTITFVPGDLEGEPGLGAFTDDGTPGEGHFPLVGISQAINAGNNATCPKTDQLGEKRVGICDIGAIEFQGTAVSSR